MKVPTVDKFLCVFDLRLGALMLGYFGTISNATYALLLLIELCFEPEEFKHEIFKAARKLDLSPGTKNDSTPLSEDKVSTTCELIKAFNAQTKISNL